MAGWAPTPTTARFLGVAQPAANPERPIPGQGTDCDGSIAPGAGCVIDGEILFGRPRRSVSPDIGRNPLPRSER